MNIIIDKKKKKTILLILLIFVAVTAIFCIVYFSIKASLAVETAALPEIDKTLYDDYKISDVASLYTDENLDTVNKIYVTVYTGVDESTGEIYDLDELNNISKTSPDPQLDATANIYNPNTGKFLFDDDTKINCIISQRGQSARRVAQKSYKIKLFDSAGSFQGQQVLNLNKHFVDTSRGVQKFCYDTISYFPDMVSLRTNFFILYMKDGTKEGAQFENYGIFTHTEQPNKTFLKVHGLDPNGTLYKPMDFEFFEDDSIVPNDSENFNFDDFSKLLKIRENPDNEKLAKMLDEINDNNNNFDEVFNKYFDTDNYLTWCAMNLLFNNYDTMSRNFLLYSPSNSDKWYFLPWDNDASLLSIEDFNQTQYKPYFGIARYWGTVLHNRFFKNPDNVALLEAKMEELYDNIMNSNIDERCERYIAAIESGFVGTVDEANGKTDMETIKNHISSYKSRIEQYKELYYQVIDKPMPMFLGEPKISDGKINFNWSPSYDLQADRLYYSFYIYTNLFDVDGSKLIEKETSLSLYDIPADLPDGEYFWGVTVYDGKGNSQISYDRYRYQAQGGSRYYFFGVRRLVIKNGEIVETR